MTAPLKSLQMCNSCLRVSSIVQQHYWDSLCTTQSDARSAHNTAQVMGSELLVVKNGFVSNQKLISLVQQPFPGFWLLQLGIGEVCSSTARLSQSSRAANIAAASHAVYSSAVLLYSFSFCHFSIGTRHTCVDTSREDYVKPCRVTTRLVLPRTSLCSAMARIRGTKVKVFIAERRLPEKVRGQLGQ